MEAFFRGVHERMCNTSSPLMLTVSSAPIGYISKAFSILVFVYVMVVTITEHTYMDFETPVVVANTYLGSGDYKAASAGATPAFCTGTEYEYNYGGGWTYNPGGCRATSGASSEVFEKSPGRASFVTFYQQSQLNLSGAYADAPVESYFHPHVEELVLYISHALTAKVAKIKEANVATVIKGKAGKVLSFAVGETPSAKLVDFLNMAGITLEDENKNSGGLGIAAGSGNTRWPRYRVTGVALQFQMTYKNTNVDRPFDFTPYLEIDVSIASEGLWNSKGPRIMTVPQPNGTWKQVERYEYDLVVFLKTAGKIGTPSAFSLIYSFLIILAGGVATFLLAEIMSGMWIHRYFEKKNFTVNNWATLTRLTFEGFQTGELQRAAMALGFQPAGPSSSELAVGGFDNKAIKGGYAGAVLDKAATMSPKKASKSNVVYIGDI